VVLLFAGGLTLVDMDEDVGGGDFAADASAGDCVVPLDGEDDELAIALLSFVDDVVAEVALLAAAVD